MMLIVLFVFILVILSVIKGSREQLESILSSKTDENIKNIGIGKTLIFYAPWCGYCKKDMPEFLKAQESSNRNIILINGDSHPELLKKYNITAYPTITKDSVVYRGQNEASKILEFANN